MSEQENLKNGMTEEDILVPAGDRVGKSEYKKWLKQENLILIQHWRRRGFSMAQIATKMGIGERTLYQWRDKYPQISTALKVGRTQTIAMMESAMIKKAMNGHVEAGKFMLSKWDREQYYEEGTRSHDGGALEQQDALQDFMDKLMTGVEQNKTNENGTERSIIGGEQDVEPSADQETD